GHGDLAEILELHKDKGGDHGNYLVEENKDEGGYSSNLDHSGGAARGKPPPSPTTSQPVITLQSLVTEDLTLVQQHQMVILVQMHE
ncbi:Hypothetical predicted protein, partial [Marmota monax]